MEQQLVVFDLAGESYGINIAAVESIIKVQTITQLPQAPYYVKGVTNLRGTVLPVIDRSLGQVGFMVVPEAHEAVVRRPAVRDDGGTDRDVVADESQEVFRSRLRD